MDFQSSGRLGTVTKARISNGSIIGTVRLDEPFDPAGKPEIFAAIGRLQGVLAINIEPAPTVSGFTVHSLTLSLESASNVVWDEGVLAETLREYVAHFTTVQSVPAALASVLSVPPHITADYFDDSAAVAIPTVAMACAPLAEGVKTGECS